METIINKKIDLYKVLKVNPNATPKEIKKNFLKLSKKYHPDKSNGDLEKFNLINTAYRILTNTVEKQKYLMLSKSYTNHHFNLRDQFTSFLEEQKSQKNEDQAKINFTRLNEELNKKHNFKKTEISETYNPELLKTDYNNYLASREHDFNIPQDPALLQNFNKNTFNDLFVSNAMSNTTDIIINEIPDAIISGNNNNAFDKSFDNLYENNCNSNNNNWSNLNDAFRVNPIDMKKFVNKDIKDRLAEYKSQTDYLHNLKRNDYKNTFDYQQFTIMNDQSVTTPSSNTTYNPNDINDNLHDTINE